MGFCKVIGGEQSGCGGGIRLPNPMEGAVSERCGKCQWKTPARHMSLAVG